MTHCYFTGAHSVALSNLKRGGRLVSLLHVFSLWNGRKSTCIEFWSALPSNAFFSVSTRPRHIKMDAGTPFYYTQGPTQKNFKPTQTTKIISTEIEWKQLTTEPFLLEARQECLQSPGTFLSWKGATYTKLKKTKHINPLLCMDWQ